LKSKYQEINSSLRQTGASLTAEEVNVDPNLANIICMSTHLTFIVHHLSSLDSASFQLKFPYWEHLHGFWQMLPNFNPQTFSSDPGQQIGAEMEELIMTQDQAIDFGTTGVNEHGTGSHGILRDVHEAGIEVCKPFHVYPPPDSQIKTLRVVSWMPSWLDRLVQYQVLSFQHLLYHQLPVPPPQVPSTKGSMMLQLRTCAMLTYSLTSSEVPQIGLGSPHI
jgi:hypothetical protein